MIFGIHRPSSQNTDCSPNRTNKEAPRVQIKETSLNVAIGVIDQLQAHVLAELSVLDSVAGADPHQLRGAKAMAEKSFAMARSAITAGAVVRTVGR